MVKEAQSKDVDEVLKTFLFSQLSDSHLIVYRCVASLDYPILDKYSLKRQVEDRSDEEIYREAFQLILSTLQPIDFRLDTPQGALEKVSQRLGGCCQEWEERANQVDQLTTQAINEADKIKTFFQGWQEKGNQIDQQLASVLRTMKDVRRIGVGGSDLGSS